MNTFLLLCNTGLLMILVLAELSGIYLVTHKRKQIKDTIDYKLGYEEMKFKIGGKPYAKRTQTKTTGSTKVTPKAQESKASTTRKKDKPAAR